MRLTAKDDYRHEVALRPRTKDGGLVGFVRREETNDLWITTRGRHQVSPIVVDAIDNALDEFGIQRRNQSEQDGRGQPATRPESK